MSKAMANRLARLEERCHGEGLPEHARWYAERLEDWPEKYLLEKQGRPLSPEQAAEEKVQCRQLAARLRVGELGQQEDHDLAVWEIAGALPREVLHWFASVDEMILADELPDDVSKWLE